MRVIDEVDMIIHALDHERAFWTDTQFVRGLSQRRAVGGINRRTLDIDARLRKGQDLDGSDRREQWLALSAGNDANAVLGPLTARHAKTGAQVSLPAHQHSGSRVSRH